MSEDVVFAEGDHVAEPLAMHVNTIIEAVADYRHGSADGFANSFVHMVQRSHAINELVEFGIPEDEAEANANAVEGRYHPDATAGHSILAIQLGESLQLTGLALSDDASSRDIFIHDGALLYTALDSSQLDPSHRERLATNLSGFFADFIKDTQKEVVYHQEADIVQVLREDFDTNVWISADEPYAEDLKQSIGQVVDHAPALAARIEEAGGHEETAQYLRDLATYDAQGDIIPWAIAGEMGLMPDTKREWQIDLWESWQTVEEWSPLFKVLDASNPIGLFKDNLKQNVQRLLTERQQQAREYLQVDFETYREDEIAYYRKRADEDDEFSAFPPNDTDMRHDYESGRRSNQNILVQYDLLQQKLTAYSQAAA